MKTLEDMRRYVADGLAGFEQRTSLPFVIERAQEREAIGSTRFGNIVPGHRRVEIGWTWIVPSHQRTAANTECKLLLLEFAFETWNCVRVELKTDALNTESRSAIERIGARHEGTLRKHMLTDTGRLRDTVYYSILDSEWPDVKRRLRERLRATPSNRG